METVRKTKVASEPAINETIIIKDNWTSQIVMDTKGLEPEQVEQIKEALKKPLPTEEEENAAFELATQETPLPQTTTPTTEPKQNILDEAPTLYGNNPTAQEIEQFKQREQVWRQKLAANLK